MKEDSSEQGQAQAKIGSVLECAQVVALSLLIFASWIAHDIAHARHGVKGRAWGQLLWLVPAHWCSVPMRGSFPEVVATGGDAGSPP